MTRMRQYKLDTWLPGKHAIARLGGSQYTRVSAHIVDQLVRHGYDMGDHDRTPTSSTFDVDGLVFRISTDDWAVASDATQLRGIIHSGLMHVARTDRARLERLHRNTLEGLQDTLLTTIIIAAVAVVTPRYGVEFGCFTHGIGVSALEHASV
jgi:hypothetical protein